MRSDLNKVLCEHERRGSSKGFRAVRRDKDFARIDVEGEFTRSHESMKQRYGWDTKDFGEHLNPLKGQVRKAVGRRWDDFYSELCKNFDMSAVVNEHILQHLYDYVETEVIVKDGKLFTRSYSFGVGDLPLELDSCEFFVDPRTNIIRRNKHRRSWKARYRDRQKFEAEELAKVERKIDGSRTLKKVNDTWFLHTVRPLPLKTTRWDETKQEHVRIEKPTQEFEEIRTTAPKKLLRSIGL